MKTILMYSLALTVGYLVSLVYFYLTEGIGEIPFTEPILGLIGGIIGLCVAGYKIKKLPAIDKNDRIR